MRVRVKRMVTSLALGLVAGTTYQLNANNESK